MAIEFRLMADPDPTVYRTFTIASQAYAIGDCVMLSPSAATVIPATASTAPSRLIGVAMEAKTASDTSLLVALITPFQTWAADANAAVNTAHNLQRMVLTDKGTVNNTGTDSTAAGAVFMQLATLSGQRIVGRFLATASA